MLAACGDSGAIARPPQPSPSPVETATPQPATDAEAIRQLIVLEGAGVVSQDLAGLMGLWADDAVIADARHTPDDVSDDARWRGRDAIRDRYVVLVFPGAPSSAGAAAIDLAIEGDAATATSTTSIGDEVAPLGDRWTFVRRDGRWWISSLTYNLEPLE
jgi:ketosteroid isomerase-like protein